MSSSKQRDTHETPSSSRASPAVSFVLSDMQLTPASLLSTTSSSNRRQTARRTLLKATRERHNTGKQSQRNSILNTPKENDNQNSTTTTADNSMILLPPSQTISESLSALAISTSKELELVWDEIGFSPEERADELTNLLASFKQICQEKIESEKMVAQNYRQMITEYKEEIRETSLALKMDVDESLFQSSSDTNNGGQSLQDEAMTLDMKLEDLRSIADVARKELQKYRDELVENHNALGWTLEEYWLDISSDLTRNRILEFRDKVEEVAAKVQHRTSAIVQLIKDCQDMIKILRCHPEENDLDQKIMTSLMNGEDGNLTIASKFESDTCTGISSETFDKLTQRLSDLHVEKKERKRTLNDLGALIGELWEKLDVPKEEQRRFAESASISVNGLGMDVIRKGEQELERLRVLKSEMMGKLILEAREKIEGLWNETNTTDEQRNLFKSIHIQDESQFDDALLTEHEEYIEVLVTRLEHMRPILELIKRRESIVVERMQYEEFQKDPDRLRQRGAVQQIRKEERMSRRIQKELPKYTERLEKKLQEWAMNNNEDFLFNGQIYLDVMDRQEEEWVAYKDAQKKMKLEKKQKLLANENGGYNNKGSSNARPLADKTNRARPISRLRAISRGRNQKEDPSKSKFVKRDDSRGKMRTESRGRTTNISRGRATSTTRGLSRSGNR